jgi:hypothetical protein
VDEKEFKEWRNSVDERLVNLVSSQKTTDDDLDEIRVEQAKFDRVLRGDPEENREGMAQSLDRLQAEVTKFNRIFDKDHLGNGGLREDISYLMDDRRRHERREDNAWKFVTAICVQFLILIGLLIVNWDRIQEFLVLHEHIYQAASIERDTKRKKAARARHKRKAVVIPEGPNEPETSDVSE